METMAPDPAHRLLYIKVRQETVEDRGSLYEAVRWAWRVNPARAADADWVVAVVGGVARGVFEVHRWQRSSTNPERWEFRGAEVDNDAARRYVGKLIPEEFRRRGMASPVLYGWGRRQGGPAVGPTGGDGAGVAARRSRAGSAERRHPVDDGSGSARPGPAAVSPGGHRLLLAITRCPGLGAARTDGSHPCAEVVRSQGSAGRQVPEPWSGRLDAAPILFVGSNPSIGEDGGFPTSSWSERDTVSYFSRRFDERGGWVSAREFNQVRYWTMVRSHAKALLGRDAVPGVDFAMTEAVHCKSKAETGVKSALRACAARWLDGVMRESAAKVVVLLGRHAEEVCTERWGMASGRGAHFGVSLAGRNRSVVVLPHPNAREPRRLARHVAAEGLRRLRTILADGVA